MDTDKSLFQRLLAWRGKNIKDKHFVLILSFVVGILTALAASLLKFLIEYIKHFLTENFDSTGVNWLYLVYPVIGILLTGLPIGSSRSPMATRNSIPVTTPFTWMKNRHVSTCK